MSRNTSAPVRRFLFLQGPHGPFFAALAARLLEEGHEVRRVHFNGGDRGDWLLPGGEAYTGAPEDWKDYLADCLRRHDITDIVFNGYWRPVHRAAILLGRDLGLRLHGFEEGLLRPHWIMLDPRLPCEQAEAFREEVPVLAAGESDESFLLPPAPPASFSRWRMIAQCVRYYVNIWRWQETFPRHVTHRLLSPGVEARGWIWQAAKNVFWRRPLSFFLQRAVLRDPRPFFLLCLQLDGDSQIRHYARHRNMAHVLEDVLANFARHAPRDTRLVVKGHPLDNGRASLSAVCRRLAHGLGIADRVTFMHFGKLPALFRGARGMVTVNSSAGLQAFHHQCPVKTLGLAVYNIPGLADPQPLEGFWRAPAAPDMRVYKALYRLLVGTTQHAGSFHAPSCYPAMVDSCMKVIMAAPPAAQARADLDCTDLDKAA